ncbi:thioredoxin family protein [Maribellus mangrovi]|uniref:thioredoxin family protein n=1 Tax=Maribellus mangrovi TaxID=3133146 RepID=UPI0030EC7938
MKQYLILTFSLLLSINAFSQEIEFTPIKNLEEAFHLAKDENKLLFIDCSTDWCGHCKVMEKTVFTIPEIADFYKSHFICIKVNPDKKEWEFIKELYPIHAYPTYLFVDSNGQLQHMKVSGTAAQEFLQAGKTAISEKNMLWFKNKLKSGDNSLETIYGYYSCNKYDEGKKEAIKQFVNSASIENLYSKDAWNLLTESISNNDTIFNSFILREYSKYFPSVGEKEVIQLIEDKLSFSVWRWGKKSQRDKAAEKLSEKAHPLTDRCITAGLVKSYAGDFDKKPNSKNKEALVKTCEDYMEYQYLNWNKLQEAAWSVSNNFDKHKDSELMNKAIVWINKSIEARPTQSNLYCKAKLLEQIGKNEEAIISANKAKQAALEGKTYVANYISVDFIENYITELKNVKM